MQIDERWLHPVSRRSLDELAVSAPHALIIEGSQGVGLMNAAQYLAKAMDGTVSVVLPERDEKIDLEKGTITIDCIRRLYHNTKTIAATKRVVIINFAETMGVQAQNAFLKLLEEPSASTHFVLLSTDSSALLPTITSRAQHLRLHRPATLISEALLDDAGITDAIVRAQFLFIADGLPELLTWLATDSEAFESRATIMRDARELVQGTTYTRLRIAHRYKDDRKAAVTLVTDAMRLIRMTMPASASSEHIERLSRLLEVNERLNGNGNIRLQLASLVV
jgi:hypothetical protein